jgi:hypothetical protein
MVLHLPIEPAALLGQVKWHFTSPVTRPIKRLESKR